MESQSLTPQQAVKVLINAAQVGQKAGAYSFEDSTLIFQAIGTLTQPAPAASEMTEATEVVAKEEK